MVRQGWWSRYSPEKRGMEKGVRLPGSVMLRNPIRREGWSMGRMVEEILLGPRLRVLFLNMS